MKIFKVTMSETKLLETLVLSKSRNDAEYLVRKAILSGILDFEDSLEKRIKTESAHSEDISKEEILNSVLKEIKDYGILILNDGLELVYDSSVIEELNKNKVNEEFLKKNHLEFKFE